MIPPLETLSISAVAKLYAEKKLTVRELVHQYLDVLGKDNPNIHAVLEVYEDVVEQADRAQKMLDEGKATVLTGIPIVLKDNILRSGHIASAGSKILENYRATYNATAVSKLAAQGVVFLGRANMDEFAMGSSTESSAYGVTRNPHDTNRVPGGSSGGSAAAVAMRGVLAALGSDTGGSVRQPAALCGVVGFKPTYGRVSRHGLMAMGSSLDQIGPITQNVTDSEIIHNAIAGQDSMDSTTLSEEVFAARASQKTTVKKIGVPRDLLASEGIEEYVKENFNEALKKLESLGYELVDITLPNAAYALATYYIIMPAEVSSNLARFDGVKYGAHVDGKNLLEDYKLTRGEKFGPEVRRRILVGTYVLSSGYYDAYYGKAQRARQLIAEDFNKAFETVDVIVTPTSPSAAFKIGEKSADPLAMYVADLFTIPANMASIPAISVPSGFVEMEGKKLPLGIQFMAPQCADSLTFAVGKRFMGETEA
jgi:aspartyl-tRNA(Asn)/glutamyl-tRNA(Gln) amidotransferase subunit A